MTATNHPVKYLCVFCIYYSQLPQMGGQAPNMNGQPPQMNRQAPNGEAPSDLPDLSEMDGAAPVMGGLLNELLAEGIMNQSEYDALCEASAKQLLSCTGKA
ncbi:MAG: hypothetical protein K6C09_00300 [Oscillospiraceae bacterium]|nr:hypothetical protein [Oscillospiraceae bacterium]